jgi:hypothetical protein
MAKQRNKHVPTAASSYDDAFEAYQNVINPNIQKQGFATIGRQASSDFMGFNTGIGKSSYDKGLNWNADIDEDDVQGSVNEYRAKNQSNWSKAGAGLARAGVKALSEVAKLPGVIGGIAMSAAAEDGEGFDTAFNNQWIKIADSINENIKEEYLPVYVKKAVKEGDIWTNLSSVDFWATEGADGVGYIASMMVPGAIFESAALGGKLINGIAKASKFAKMVKSTEGAVSALKAAGITGKAIDGALAVTGNTIFEAGAEAKSVGDSMERQKEAEIQKYMSEGFDSAAAVEKFNQLHPDFENQRALAMRDNFLFNTAVLIGPNAIMHKAIWGKAGKTYTKSAEKGREAILKRISNSGNRYLKAGASEGLFEEGLQTTSEEFFKEKGMQGELGTGLSKEDIGDFAKSYIDMATSTEGQKAMVLGGLLGGGMTSYQGRKSDLDNIKKTNAVIQAVENRFDNFNTKFDEEIYKKDKNGEFIFKKDENGNLTNQREVDPKGVISVAKSLNFTEEQSDLFDYAMQNGNEKIINQIKQKAIFDLVLPSIYNGDMGMQVLEEKLNSDSKFNEIIENDQFSDAKNNSKQFVKDVLDTAKYLKKQNEKFTDFSKDIIDLDGLGATQEQKDNFIDHLNRGYLNVKHIARQEQLTLDKLKEKREAILSDINLPKELVTEDELLVNAEKNNEILKSVNDEIRESEATLQKYNQDIAEIWGSKDITKKAFEKFVKEDNQLNEELSPENELAFEDVKNDIKSIETKEDLRDYVKRLDDKYKNNPDIQLDIQDHYKFLDNVEKNEQELSEIEKLELDKENFSNDSINNKDTDPSISETIVDKTIVEDQRTIQSSDTADLDKNNEKPIPSSNSDLNIKSDEMIKEINEEKNQGAAKIISTNRFSGGAIPGFESFTEYEKVSRDKRNDKVTFDYGDLDYSDLSKSTKNAVKKLKEGETLTEEDKELLINFLPIKVNLTNGESTASSFIESMGGSSENIVAAETLPLRKAIISELIKNKGDFNGIFGKVEKQFPGILLLDKNIDSTDRYNNIKDLDVFKGMTDDQKIDYFKKNTVYVSNKGVVKYCSTDIEDSNKTMKSSNKGEVFLKIPQLNGEMFYLKLNTARLSDEKASSVLQLIILRSNLLNEGTDMSFEELKEYVYENGIEAIDDEINLIQRNSDSIDQTIERLINLIVYSQNTNAKTKLILGKDGTLVLGELLHKVNAQIPEWSGQLESYTYTNETLNKLNSEQFNAIKEYLKYKRHNIIITDKNDSGSFTTFSNDEYIKYLLGMGVDYPILRTNAVVNKPTFGGYSNIYLSQSVSNSNKPQVIAEKVSAPTVNVENTEDFLDSLEDLYGEDVIDTVKIQVLENTNKYLQKTEVKVLKSENLKEIFDNSNDKDKSKILAITAKQLGMMDKINPKEIESSFNNLYETLKENKTLQDDIKKICGI